MTKADIVNEITKNTGIDKTTVLTTVEAFMDAVKASLSKDENVYLRGFGSFVVKKRAQKTARNISKNTTIIIPEHNIPAFKPFFVLPVNSKLPLFLRPILALGDAVCAAVQKVDKVRHHDRSVAEVAEARRVAVSCAGN